MVKITSYQLRKSEGKEFYALILQSGIEIIKSQSGGTYATARKISVPSTFSEENCKDLLGHEIAGSIKSVPCEEYTFIIPETGEEVIRDTHNQYFPEE